MFAFLRAFVLVSLLVTAAAAADLTGIWMGEVAGPKGEKQDVAFQFQMVNGKLTGTLFGDEFDVPLQDLNLTGDKVTFTVTNVNYYGGRHVKTAYTGTLNEKTLELTREQVEPPPNANPDRPKGPRRPIVLKRLTS